MNLKMLKEELECILGEEISTRAIKDMPQFIEIYLEEMRDSIREYFKDSPEQLEKITEHYNFVLSDFKNPYNPIFK